MKREATVAAITSLLLAVAAAGYLLFGPLSLVAREGPSVIGPIALPVILAGLCVLFSRLGLRNGIWICAALAPLFSVISIFSIGLFFFPAAILMVLSAVILSLKPRTRLTSSTGTSR